MYIITILGKKKHENVNIEIILQYRMLLQIFYNKNTKLKNTKIHINM